jgi:diguanylate cyclase (GGDEF)-like protein
MDAEIRRVERVFHPLCLMMIDLDNFRVYNDKNGREKGDDLLKKVAGLLKENVRSTEIFCRQAQDQFLVLLPETKKDEALALAKTVKDIVQNALVDSNVTCSIGMSRFIIGMTSQEFFLQANLGLYMAKEVGKNEACMYG